MELQDLKPTPDSVDVFASGAIGGVLSWMLGKKSARHGKPWPSLLAERSPLNT